MMVINSDQIPLPNNGYEFEDYQSNIISSVSFLFRTYMSVLVQSETGSGKTVIFSGMAHRFIHKTNKDVIVFVYKKELMDQFRQTVYDWYGHIAEKIDQETKTVRKARIYVAMVETFDNRTEIERFLSMFNNIGLVIIDEAHMGNFNKIMLHFPLAKRVGFTATPVAAKKKEPLKDYYSKLVLGPKTSELIQLNKIKQERGVVPCLTYSIRNVDRSKLRQSSNGDFDEDHMGEVFGQIRQIQNTIDAYLRISYGQKTICFNANREHSIKMHEAFLANGLNSRHLDSKKSGKYGSDKYRADCFRWLKHTPDAILNNVGIATTGFDEKSIETVITNLSTKSITKFRQMAGRGARPFKFPSGIFKTHFTHIDMGDNVIGGGHGQWSDEVDWEFIFENPKIPKAGTAIYKSCPECGALNYGSARVCVGKRIEFLTDEEIDCEYLFPIKQAIEDTTPKEIVLITDNIDVKKNFEFFSDRAEYYSMFQTYKQIAKLARKNIEGEYLDSVQLQNLYTVTHRKISEWYKLSGKRKFSEFRENVKNKMIQELKSVGFIVMPEEMELIDLQQI
jgi:superfamily II DNA or RNA helicase